MLIKQIILRILKKERLVNSCKVNCEEMVRVLEDYTRVAIKTPYHVLSVLIDCADVNISRNITNDFLRVIFFYHKSLFFKFVEKYGLQQILNKAIKESTQTSATNIDEAWANAERTEYYNFNLLMDSINWNKTKPKLNWSHILISFQKEMFNLLTKK